MRDQLLHAPSLVRVFGRGLLRAVRMAGGMEREHPPPLLTWRS